MHQTWYVPKNQQTPAMYQRNPHFPPKPPHPPTYQKPPVLQQKSVFTNSEGLEQGGGFLRNPIAWGVLNPPPFFKNGPRGVLRVRGGQNQKWPRSKWARWLHHPCRLGDPPRFKAGGQNQKWPTSGQGGYITPVASGIPSASERGAESEVAQKWARWLRNPWCLGDPHRLRAGGKIRSGPQVGNVATSPLPPRGSPPLKSGGQNQK